MVIKIDPVHKTKRKNRTALAKFERKNRADCSTDGLKLDGKEGEASGGRRAHTYLDSGGKTLVFSVDEVFS